MTAHDQVVRYAQVGDRTVAWSSVGSGPPLVVGGWWASHLALNWEDRLFRAFLTDLARTRTVIRYDRPGTGLSDRLGPVPASLHDELAILTALVEVIGLRRFSMLGASAACAVASAYAAAHPDRVDRLVLYGGFLRGADIAPPSARELMLSLVNGHWGLGSRVLADVFLPNASADEREEFAQFQRQSASRETASASLQAVYELDAHADLARVRTPTLVLHRRDDRAIPFALGRELAAAVPGAVFVELEGEDHFPWRGQSHAVVEQIELFLSGKPLRTVSRSSTSVELTAREREVLLLVAEGLTDAQIAERLVLSAHTVHRHVANARNKLGVASRAAAAAWAVTHRSPRS